MSPVHVPRIQNSTLSLMNIIHGMQVNGIHGVKYMLAKLKFESIQYPWNAGLNYFEYSAWNTERQLRTQYSVQTKHIHCYINHITN